MQERLMLKQTPSIQYRMAWIFVVYFKNTSSNARFLIHFLNVLASGIGDIWL